MARKLSKWIACLIILGLLGIGLLANLALAQEKTQGTQIQEEYVSKEILFLPWGSKEGECALLVTEMSVQGIATVTVRYGARKLEVDKDGNIYVWNKKWGKGCEWQPVVEQINNPYVYKYVKEKITKGKRIVEKYKYHSSIPLSKLKKSPLLIEKFKSGYRYEKYRLKEGDKIIDRIGFKIIEDNTGKTIKELDYLEGLEDDDTWAATVIGDDINKNVYVLVDTTDAGVGPEYEHGWRLKVNKYNKEGVLLAIIELAKEIEYLYRFAGQKDRITVDKDGNIYQLLPKEDGVHILKYEVK